MRTPGSSHHAQTPAVAATMALREAEGRPASGELVQQGKSFFIERRWQSTSPPSQEKYRSSYTEADAQQDGAGTQLNNFTKTKEKPCRKQISRQDCPWASALKETQIKTITQMSQMWKEHRIEN